MRLYTAKAIKEQLHKLLCQDCEETDVCLVCDYRELIDEILDAPTVDADSLNARHEDIGYEKGFRDGYAEALEVTDDAKRNGHWIENDTTYSNVTRQTCTCSVCGRHSPRPLGDFCRWCGGKMDERIDTPTDPEAK